MRRLVQHADRPRSSASSTTGPGAFQLFDSWAGALAAADYDAFVLPHSHGRVRRARRPPPGCAGHPLRHRLRPPARVDARRRPAACSGLDWRTSIAEARRRLGADLVVQGNLDPALVLAGSDVALAGTDAVLADNGGHPGHIFNLGHGVQPNTDPGRARGRSSIWSRNAPRNDRGSARRWC